MTNPPKKGKVGPSTSFGGPTPHMVDDYNNPKILAHKELEYHWSKLQDKPFSQQAKKLNNGVFNQPKDIYDIRDDIKESPKAVREVNKVEHERPFKPSHPSKKGPGAQATIEKFPEYKENPLKHTVRVKPVEGVEEPARWKMTTNSYSSPTSSIACNMRNMKASFPTVFRR